MKERRKRVSRPKRLLFFGIFFLILPILNYVGMAIRNKYAYYEFINIVSEFRIFELILLVIPIFVGIGILLVQKWGWWLFLFYSGILIFYNILILILEPKPYNINSLIQTLIFFSAIYYFLKKDVSAPFLFRPLEFGLGARIQKKLNSLFSITDGFRKSKRKNIHIDIQIGNSKIKTLDFSLTGFYGTCSSFEYTINEPVQIGLFFNEKKLQLNGGVVRIDEIENFQVSNSYKKIGIAFRDLSNEQKAILQTVLN